MEREKFKIVSMRQVESCAICGEGMSTSATCCSCGCKVCLDCAEEHECQDESDDAEGEVLA